MLVDRDLAERLRDLPGYTVRPLHRVSVRGYDHLQPWLVRRRPADDGHDESGYDQSGYDESGYDEGAFDEDPDGHPS
jgi:adenylate cyclase